MFRKLFLPVGILVALLLSFVCPAPGVFVKELQWNNYFIIVTFLICGWGVDFSTFKFDRRFAAVLAGAAVVAMIIAPLLGWGLATVLGIGALPMAGLLAIMAAPPTLSSGVAMTASAGGNALLALIMTVGYNLLGVITMPLIFTLCLHGGEDIVFDPVQMFLKLVLLVLLPTLVGYAGKWLTKKALPRIFHYISALAVILLVLGFFSGSREQFLSRSGGVLLLEGGCALVLHVLLLLVMLLMSFVLKAKAPEAKAMIFCGASKTVTIGLTTLDIIGLGSGEAMVTCLVYYFVQSVVDSLVAGKIGFSEQKLKESENASDGKCMEA